MSTALRDTVAWAYDESYAQLRRAERRALKYPSQISDGQLRNAQAVYDRATEALAFVREQGV